MDYRDVAAYLWQGGFALGTLLFLPGMFIMAAEPAGFPWLAAAGLAAVALSIIPWTISLADDRPVEKRGNGWL